ncbi:uncharacterized protein LOC141591274 isoform X2 [Silene latifolia]|uniref:uncharacterized protein LOC141591274 isoform X2 n=1 Tax=Silene latifolia TaxID=37657 RepID=UPI003D78706A
MYNPWDPPPPPPPPSDFEWGQPPDQFQYPPPPPDYFPAPPFLRKRKFDRQPVDINAPYAKLYIGPVPRHVCQDEVYHLFQDFGNVVEVVLLTDKKTGLQQEFCFVKYSSVDEAEDAIHALHNQFTFPGAMASLKVKYADGERKRLGLDHIMPQDSSLSRSGTHCLGLAQHDSTFTGQVSAEIEHKVHKLYVNGLNRDASIEEIAEIFSSYGVVTDIYIMRDDSKRSRGLGFVGFTQKCMAMAAINGLHGTYMMRGCDKPLVVRFADPKKRKNGDFRPTLHSADTRRDNVSNAIHLGNSATCSKLNSSGEQGDTNCLVANQLGSPPHESKRIVTVNPFSPSRLSQMSLQEPETLQSPKNCTDSELNSAKLSCGHGSLGLSEKDYSAAFEGCDWSEHICPDGNKYYFNRVTSESRWEKPEEFAICEQKLQNLSHREPHASSTLEALPNVNEHIEAVQAERETCELEKAHLKVSCAVEHSHEVAPVEPNSVGEATFVQ